MKKNVIQTLISLTVIIGICSCTTSPKKTTQKEEPTGKWVKYEIEKAYQLNKGIVGIRIHKLKDMYGNQTTAGANPFYSLYTQEGYRLSNYIEVFDSNYSLSTYVYDDIKENIEQLIENAIENAGTY